MIRYLFIQIIEVRLQAGVFRGSQKAYHVVGKDKQIRSNKPFF